MKRSQRTGRRRKKNCQKTPCGATCIETKDICRLDSRSQEKIKEISKRSKKLFGEIQSRLGVGLRSSTDLMRRAYKVKLNKRKGGFDRLAKQYGAMPIVTKRRGKELDFTRATAQKLVKRVVNRIKTQGILRIKDAEGKIRTFKVSEIFKKSRLELPDITFLNEKEISKLIDDIDVNKRIKNTVQKDLAVEIFSTIFNRPYQLRNAGKKTIGQIPTEEDRKAVLQWYEMGGSVTSPARERIPKETIDILWDLLGDYDKYRAANNHFGESKLFLQQAFKVKGGAGRDTISNSAPTVERGKNMVELLLLDEARCAITGTKLNFFELQPDHKDPSKGEITRFENMVYVSGRINTHKGKKNWDTYYLDMRDKFDPSEAKKKQATKANKKLSTAIEVRDKMLKNDTSDFAYPTLTEYKKATKRIGVKDYLKEWGRAANTDGSYGLSKGGRDGNDELFYQALRYRFGYIQSVDDISPSIFENAFKTATKKDNEPVDNIKELIASRYDPNISLEASLELTKESREEVHGIGY